MASPYCKEILNMIPLYLDNELSAEDADNVRRHIESCDCCKKEAEFLASLMKTASSLEETAPSVDFHKNLMKKALDIKNENRRKRILLLRRYGIGAASAAVVVLCFVAFGNINRGNEISHVEPSSQINPSMLSRTVETQDSSFSQAPLNEPVAEVPAENSKIAPAPNAESNSRDKASLPATVSVEGATTTYTFGGGENTPEAHKDVVIPSAEESVAAVSAEEITDSEAFDEPLISVMAEVSVTDENEDAIMEILSHYEKDTIGYIVPDITHVLEKIAEITGADIVTQECNGSAINYIILN